MAGENERELAKNVSDAVNNLRGALSGENWGERETEVIRADFASVKRLYAEFCGSVGVLMLESLRINVYVDPFPILLAGTETGSGSVVRTSPEQQLRESEQA